MVPQVIELTERLTLGEGPHWDSTSQSLYFVDIFGCSIHKYVPATKKHTKAKIEEGYVSLIVPVEGKPNQFLITINCQVALITWDGESETVSDIKKIAETTDNNPDLRFNDGKTDSNGCLWLGTMVIEKGDGNFEDEKGSFYSLQKDGTLKKHFEKVGISNGLAWNDNLKKFYYVDSLRRSVDEFDYDTTSETITNRKTVFNLAEKGVHGFPDGMAIDTDGNLWLAVFDGSKVLKIDPRTPNTLLKSIEIPARQVTSVAFGGSKLDELFVTTANVVIKNVKLETPNGALFKITNTGSKGYAGVNFKPL